MHPKQFALIAGMFFLALGGLALVPALSSFPPEGLPGVTLNSSFYGEFLGLFPMNIVNKLFLIALGVGGLWAYSRPATSLPASIKFARVVCFTTLAGTVLGLIPATNTLFGYMPLYGHDIWLHALAAATGAYFGYALTSKVTPEDRLPGGDRYARVNR